MGKSTLLRLRLFKSLAEWFERQKRVLPWRDDPSLYRVWISEIMLQQTQVVTVVPYFEKFVARFPSVEALAQASEDEVLMQWAGLGYYSRARNLKKGAQKIVESGRFPQTREEWEEIPGVGPYTAGAILSIALDQPEAILDGNVERVLSRLRKVDREKGDAAFKSRLWSLSRGMVRRAAKEGIPPSVLNQALMELGARICTPRKPQCKACPLAPACCARKDQSMEAYPPRKKPKKWLKVHEELQAVFNRKGQVLLCRREPGEWRAGLWDFLTDLSQAGLKDLVNLGTIETRHVVTRHKITRSTQVWLLRKTESPQQGRWVSVSDPDVALGSAPVRVLKQVAAKFPECFPATLLR